MQTNERTQLRTERVNIAWAPEEGRDLASYVFLLGRLLFGGFFLYSGIMHVINFGMLSGVAANAGVPLAEIGVALSVVFLVVGGASILLGFKPHLFAWWPILFLLPAVFYMHAFWTLGDPQQVQIQTAFFLRNIALTGALLMIASIPRWPLSVGRGSMGRGR